MFDEKQINAYHNIKAPDSIYRRLKRKNYSFAAIAACLVCAFMISMFFIPHKNEIIVNGQTIENSVVISEGKARSTEIEVPIELKNINKKTEITASEGKIFFNEHMHPASVIAEDDTTIIWYVEKDSLPCEISISDRNRVEKFTLIYENSQYILRRNEK